jgi:putative oxidoreductase
MLSQLNRHSDWSLVVLRLVIGAIFLYHGISKWQMHDADTVFSILKIAEPLGGLALIVGALTQWAALGLSVIMIGAIYMKASGFGQSTLNFSGTFSPQGGMGWEFEIVVLAGCLVLLFIGAGKLSIDAILKKE